jgi:RNA polymerase sigma factor (TIGR02999 family)
MSDVTQILNQINSGDPSAADQLLPLVYDELRMLAAAKLAHEKPGQTLQATALVHEAYLRLVGKNQQQPNWDSRGHFFAAAAESMRRILVDNARRKKRGRLEEKFEFLDFDITVSTEDSEVDLIALDEVLTKFAAEDPVKAKLVNLRYFVGLTMPEIAKILGISLATTERYWVYARTWLYNELRDSENSPKKT